jgi:cyclopropane fatty-acyl-phospholipid synthase-like methyltransferase
MSTVATTSAAFFQAKYQVDVDPWNFAADDYEQARYRTILQALSHQHYHLAWEPGCSVGVLTEQLAGLCDGVDACDFAEAAVEQARQRCAHLPGVQVRCASLTDDAAVRSYDLVVLSEIGYYFTAEEWRFQIERIASCMQPGATLLAAHWLGYSADHIQGGDDVHASLMRLGLLKHEHGERHEVAGGGFRLDRWSRA